MSFTDSRSRYENIGPASGINQFEKEYLTALSHGAIDEDHAVELFVDDLRDMQCHFAFKQPLGGDFYEARDHALNCLEMREVTARRVHHWVEDSLKCVDVLLIVYLRDVLSETIATLNKNRPKERDVYEHCQNMIDESMKALGAKLDAVYQHRSNPLVHHQIVDEHGERRIRKVSRKVKNRIYEFARESMKESLDILVPRYRDAFPRACLDRGVV